MSVAACGYAAAIVLAAAFVLAATAKLARHGETTEAFGALGVPGPSTAAWAVPVVELLTAGLLLTRPQVGGVVALFLIVAFTVVLVDVVRRGARVRCACFGASSSHAVSIADVVRNLGLAVLALAAVWSGPPGRPPLAAAVAVGAASAAWAALVGFTRRARPASRPGAG